MTHALLIQLPIPRLHVGLRTGNISLAAACLKQAAADLDQARVELMPERVANCLGDAALVEWIHARRPDVIGFTVYAWNVQRTIRLAESLKQRYSPRIICGGPEITPDNHLLSSPQVDMWVFGEGEKAFRQLMRHPMNWKDHRSMVSPCACSFDPGSPYLNGVLDPSIENMVLLETQRGCPHRCAYCYYGKARRKCALAPLNDVLKVVHWSHARGIAEIYLLDPSLNARPDLKDLLKGIAAINHDGRLRLISELRAEAVDEAMAELFARAGFQWFEVGLQTTNPRALKAMHRLADIDAFVRGAALLRRHGIGVRVDLILGLPGDTLAEFKRSADFCVDHGLTEDIQVFPLLVLPGTAFRRKARSIGLEYEPDPPYTVIAAPTFSQEDLWSGIEYAEERFDTALYPLPAPAFAWRNETLAFSTDHQDRWQRTLEGLDCIYMIRIDHCRPLSQLAEAAGRLTNPYQVLIAIPDLPLSYLKQVISTLSRANPSSALELIFLEPADLPDTRQLLAAAVLQRPHYLDQQMRFCYPRKGNRTILFTMVSGDSRPRFQGPMQRQIFWWRLPHLPSAAVLSGFGHCDGVLIDPPRIPIGELMHWICEMASSAPDLPHLCFTERSLQYHWIKQTQRDDWDLALLAPEN